MKDLTEANEYNKEVLNREVRSEPVWVRAGLADTRKEEAKTVPNSLLGGRTGLVLVQISGWA